MAGDNPPVFVLETPGPRELVAGKSEADLLEQSLRLLNIPVIVFKARCEAEVSTAGRVFGQLSPRILHISGHGTESGNALILTDGTLLPWYAVLEKFPFSHPNGYLFASACNSLQGTYLRLAFEKQVTGGAHGVLGFESPVGWSQAALSSVVLYESLNADSRQDIYAAMLGVYVALSVNIVAYSRRNTPPLLRVSGAEILDEFARSLINRDRKVFETLISGRGLLLPDKWKQWWDNQDAARERLEKAMAATDASGALKRATSAQ